MKSFKELLFFNEKLRKFYENMNTFMTLFNFIDCLKVI